MRPKKRVVKLVIYHGVGTIIAESDDWQDTWRSGVKFFAKVVFSSHPSYHVGDETDWWGCANFKETTKEELAKYLKLHAAKA